MEGERLQKANFWGSVAIENLSVMRLLKNAGLLNGYSDRQSPLREGWRNVAEHSLVQIVAVKILGSLVGLAEEQIKQLNIDAALHDWDTRLRKRPSDITEQERQKIETFLGLLKPNAETVAATSGFPNQQKVLIRKEALSLPAKILWYVDNLMKGSELVALEERIEEVKQRRRDLDEDQEITQKLSGALGCKTTYWGVELMLSKQVEIELFDLMRQRGVPIQKPEDIPLLIRSGIEGAYRVFSQPAGPEGKQTDDRGIYVEDSKKIVAAVFDGASALSSITATPETLVFESSFASENAGLAIKCRFGNFNTARELLLSANSQVANKLREKGIDPEATSPEALPSATGTLVRVDKFRKLIEIAQLGDTVCLVKKRNGQVGLVLPRDIQKGDSQILADARKISQNKGISFQAALKEPSIAARIVKGRSLNNHQEGAGQGIINGNSNAEKYLQITSYPLAEVQKIILLTDGLLIPNEDPFAEPDWGFIVKIVEKEGLEGLYKRVREIEYSDPDLNKFPRWKVHDDATGIVIDITLPEDL